MAASAAARLKESRRRSDGSRPQARAPNARQGARRRGTISERAPDGAFVKLNAGHRPTVGASCSATTRRRPAPSRSESAARAGQPRHGVSRRGRRLPSSCRRSVRCCRSASSSGRGHADAAHETPASSPPPPDLACSSRIRSSIGTVLSATNVFRVVPPLASAARNPGAGALRSSCAADGKTSRTIPGRGDAARTDTLAGQHRRAEPDRAGRDLSPATTAGGAVEALVRARRRLRRRLARRAADARNNDRATPRRDASSEGSSPAPGGAAVRLGMKRSTLQFRIEVASSAPPTQL